MATDMYPQIRTLNFLNPIGSATHPQLDQYFRSPGNGFRVPRCPWRCFIQDFFILPDIRENRDITPDLDIVTFVTIWRNRNPKVYPEVHLRGSRGQVTLDTQ